MLSGEGADAFSRDQGLEQVDPAYFETEHRRQPDRDLPGERGQRARPRISLRHRRRGGARQPGHVAAATSTGGMTGKRWNRIGDTPIIGAGTYADDRAGAVSATGSGEMFIRVGVAHEICARMRMLGEDAATAADTVMKEVRAHRRQRRGDRGHADGRDGLQLQFRRHVSRQGRCGRAPGCDFRRRGAALSDAARTRHHRRPPDPPCAGRARLSRRDCAGGVEPRSRSADRRPDQRRRAAGLSRCGRSPSACGATAAPSAPASGWSGWAKTSSILAC